MIVELKDDVHKLLKHRPEGIANRDISVVKGSALCLWDLIYIKSAKELALMDESMRKLNTEELIKEIIKRIYQRNK